MITFIGAGNVAWHLAQAFEKAGCRIDAVYSRNVRRAKELADICLNAYATDQLNFSQSTSEIFIISVTDDAVPEIAIILQLPENSVLVHTSGTQPLRVLAAHPRTGVLYPLQTFSKNRPTDVAAIPFCIEAGDAETEAVLLKLAQRISGNVQVVSSEKRRTLHVAAVFACNFVNYLLTTAQRITSREQLPFELLAPLIRETVEKALHAGNPAAVQTGPAARNDRQTIENHIEYLSAFPREQEIYRLLTESIGYG